MTTTPTAAERFATRPEAANVDEYNFDHFKLKHFLEDVRRTVRNRGIEPGELAPDFELVRAGGGRVRLSELRGTPVLLHFGSFT